MSIDTWISNWHFPAVALAKSKVSGYLKRLPVMEALEQTYVKVNNKSTISMFVFDVDDSDAEYHVKSLVYDKKVLPEPNWITTNPATGHAHVGYYLKSPISTTEKSRVKPMLYAEAVYEKLRGVLGGDVGYSGSLTRSPLVHPTQWLRDEPYELSELVSEAKLPKRQEGISRQGMGLGRNCELFDTLRFWAYDARSKYDNRSIWKELVSATATGLADKLFAENPLSASEVRAVANSVSDWTWTHMKDCEAFSKRQSFRSRMKPTSYVPDPTKPIEGHKGSQRAAELRNKIVKMYGEGKMYKEIAAELGIDVIKVRNQLAYARRLDKKAKSKMEKDQGNTQEDQSMSEKPKKKADFDKNQSPFGTPANIEAISLSYNEAHIKVYKLRGEPDECSICGATDSVVWGYDFSNRDSDPLVLYTEMEWEDYTGEVPYSLNADLYEPFCDMCQMQNIELVSGYMGHVAKNRYWVPEFMANDIVALAKTGMDDKDIAKKLKMPLGELEAYVANMKKHGTYSW